MTPEIQVPVLDHSQAMARVGGDAELLKDAELKSKNREEFDKLIDGIKSQSLDVI